MPRKSNVRRKDGRIAVQVYLGLVDGKRKYKTVYGETQKEADKKAEDLKRQLGKGIDISPKDESFGYWANLWVESKKRECTPSQARAWERRAELFVAPFKACDIKRIKLHELQAVVDQLASENPVTGKPTAKKTLGDYISAAVQIFEYAIDNRVLEYSPAKRLKVPQNAPAKQRRALDANERKMVQETPHRAQTAAMLMLLAGLRRGEVTALLWDDIDLEKRTISITKSYDFKNKQVKSPKTVNGLRVVYIPKELASYLGGLPAREGLVFPSKAGTMMLEPAWQRLWRYYMNELNRRYGDFDGMEFEKNHKWPLVIREFTPHCLRHTYCTILYEAGVDVVTAQRLMGHSDIKTTLGIYTHLSKEKAEKDISKLDEFLECKSGASH